MKAILLSSVLLALPLAACNAQDAAKPAAAPATEKASDSAGDVAKLKLGVLPAVMKFDTPTLTVKAGQKVMLLFQNARCPLQHNFLLLKPGKLNAIGAMADKMLTDPQAIKKSYIPESPDILAHSTKLIGIGQTDLIQFTAPAEPGDYPYICTFPGHWRLMNGVLKVTAATAASGAAAQPAATAAPASAGSAAPTTIVVPAPAAAVAPATPAASEKAPAAGSKPAGS